MRSPGRRSAPLLAAALLAAVAAGTAPAGRAAGACTFLPAAAATPGEGRPDPARALPAVGTIRVALLFADPDGVAAGESPSRLAAQLAPAAERWFAAASYGRARLEVTVLPRWLRASTVAGAIRAAGADLPRADVAVAVLPQETRAFASHAEVLARGSVHYGVLLAPHPEPGSPRAPGLWHVLVHELGHVLGLPDLYVTAGEGATGLYVGPWDPMSEPLGQNLLAWHAWQLGWLGRDAVVCLPAGSTEQTLAPAGVEGGVKAILVPLSPTSAIVVEARTRTGLDAGLCEDGVLAYAVDTDTVPGAQELRVLARDDAPGSCGPLSTAALGPGESLVDAGVRIDVLDGYRVRVASRAS